MSNAVYFNIYKLKKGSSALDFLNAVKNLTDEVNTKFKEKGYVSFSLLADGETWADCSIWDSMDALNAFIESSRAASKSGTNETAETFYSFLNLNSCISRRFNIEQNHNMGTGQFDISNIVSYHSYKLKNGLSVNDFLNQGDEVYTEFTSKQTNSVSFIRLADGETWADITTFETMDKYKEFVKQCNQYFKTKGGYSFIAPGSLKSYLFSTANNKL